MSKNLYSGVLTSVLLASILAITGCTSQDNDKSMEEETMKADEMMEKETMMKEDEMMEKDEMMKEDEKMEKDTK